MTDGAHFFGVMNIFRSTLECELIHNQKREADNRRIGKTCVEECVDIAFAESLEEERREEKRDGTCESTAVLFRRNEFRLFGRYLSHFSGKRGTRHHNACEHYFVHDVRANVKFKGMSRSPKYRISDKDKGRAH